MGVVLMALEDDVNARAEELRAGPEQIEFLAELGVPSSDVPTTALAAQVKAFRGYVSEVDSSLRSPVSVFMDTTTVFTGASLLNGEVNSLSPLNLLDLDTFLRNFVLCDFIYVLPSLDVDYEAINDKIGEPTLIPLPGHAEDRDTKGFLNSIWEEACGRASWALQDPSADARRLRESWEALLGERVLPFAVAPSAPADPGEHPWLSLYQKATRMRRTQKIRKGVRLFPDGGTGTEVPEDEPIDWERVQRDELRGGSDAPLLMELQSYAIRARFRSVRVAWLVRESNARSAFNATLANDLGLAYVPGLVRTPMFNVVARNSLRLHAQLQDSTRLRQVLQESGIAPERLVPADLAAVELPLFLSVFLKELGSIDDAWSMLADMRMRAVPYRRRRAELLDALENGSRSAQRDFDAAVRADAQLWKRDAGWAMTAASVSVAAAAGGGTRSALLTALATLLVADRFDQRAREAITRRFRPHQWYLTSLSAAAEGALARLPQIERIWAITLPDKFARELHRVSMQRETLGL
jgi:hypothetical protein